MAENDKLHLISGAIQAAASVYCAIWGTWAYYHPLAQSAIQGVPQPTANGGVGMPLPLYIGILVLSISVGVPAITRLVTWLSKGRKDSDFPHATAESLRAGFREKIGDSAQLSRVQDSLKRCEEEKRGLQAQIDTPPQYKLKIHSASYGSGTTFEPVDQYLCKKATDAISARIDANLFDAYDPAPGTEKDLILVYSFGDGRRYKIDRHEKDWLALPEDPEFCFTGIQRRLMKLARALRKLVIDNPQPSKPTRPYTEQEVDSWTDVYNVWQKRVAYCYESDFADQVLKLKSAIGRQNPNLASRITPIPGAFPPPERFPELAKVFWDLAWEIEESRNEKH